MRYHHFVLSSFSLLVSVAAVLASAFVLVRTVAYDFALIALRTSAGAAIDVAVAFKVSAFQIIGALKPDYRESYDTDGLNFASASAHAGLRR